MKTCINCGNEIKMISKEPEKLYYCRKCTEKLLNKNRKIIEEENVNRNSYFTFFYIMIPGIYQIKKGEFMLGTISLFSGIIMPLFWAMLFYFEIKFELISEQIKAVNYIFTIFIVFNTGIIYIHNLINVLKGEENENTFIK
ncbi:MAG: hypothetical protein ACQERZ_02295 [Fusobacteriota bacterium]